MISYSLALVITYGTGHDTTTTPIHPDYTQEPHSYRQSQPPQPLGPSYAV